LIPIRTESIATCHLTGRCLTAQTTLLNSPTNRLKVHSIRTNIEQLGNQFEFSISFVKMQKQYSRLRRRQTKRKAAHIQSLHVERNWGAVESRKQPHTGQKRYIFWMPILSIDVRHGERAHSTSDAHWRRKDAKEHLQIKDAKNAKRCRKKPWKRPRQCINY